MVSSCSSLLSRESSCSYPVWESGLVLGMAVTDVLEVGKVYTGSVKTTSWEGML